MIPKSTVQESDDHLYVSPTSDDTLQERYEKIQAMSNAERLKALRTPSPFFPDEDDETDEQNEVEN